MRLLLDTHIFLWFITGDERVAPGVRKAIEDTDIAYLSAVALVGICYTHTRSLSSRA